MKKYEQCSNVIQSKYNRHSYKGRLLCFGWLRDQGIEAAGAEEWRQRRMAVRDGRGIPTWEPCKKRRVGG